MHAKRHLISSVITYSEKAHSLRPNIVADKIFILHPEVKLQSRSLNGPEWLKRLSSKWRRWRLQSILFSWCLTQSSVLFRMSSECAHNRTGSGTPSSGWGPLPVEFPMAISYWCHQEEEIDSHSLCFQELRSREQIAFISFSCCSTATECSCNVKHWQSVFLRRGKKMED